MNWITVETFNGQAMLDADSIVAISPASGKSGCEVVLRNGVEVHLYVSTETLIDGLREALN